MTQFKLKTAVLAVTLSMCLVSVFPLHADDTSAASAISGNDMLHPGTPMMLEPVSGAFDFDLGGSETRKLQLQLANPLMLESGSQFSSTTAGSNLLGLDATLKVPVGHGLSLRGGAEQILGSTQFQSLGSIQCMNGTLRSDSYTASGCRFVTESGSRFDRRTFSLGASHEIGNMSSSINWFTTQTEQGSAAVNRLNQFSPSPLLDNRLLSPTPADSFLPGSMTSGYLDSETTGIDLNFQVGFTTDQAGDIRFGLALTRVLDAGYQGTQSNGIGPLDWSVAEPFDSAALGIEWNRGSFSSGVRGYYREQVNFLNRQSLDSVSTFDVHFTWRTPWNANLSVGASNVLGAGADDRNASDKATDRFESVYGRIPYVRYKQDL